ncbi:aldose 1-epimerase [Cohnella faecalis]|uniref:Aldose 1-epimerase n=1 Tax=Cohnella faecalis TaxID=2315694 RepID=A0A398CVI1_9BACL|nr:aldose 1-epimerase [Cohnella faecalis]RIE03014.1 aldose 1-epimerase [Cohnella faecalis]
MGHHEATEGKYENETAIFLKYGVYSAIMLPGIGGNLISFRDEERGYRFIREPEGAQWKEFVRFPVLHGIPVLFPPNRYDAGTFEFDGRTYRLPVNEPETGNHLHGFVYETPWEVVGFGSTERESFVTVRCRLDESHPAFEFFPHRVTLTQTYTLSSNGLTQAFEAVNEGSNALPFMLGFHTTLNVPFATGSSVEDVVIGIAIGERWELNERQLPTGRLFPLDEGETKLREGGNPFYTLLDNHYTADSAENGRNAAFLFDRKADVRFVYDAGREYKHWMVFNGKGSTSFICPEPQTGMVNAPNVDLPPERTGLVRLEPGERWSSVSRYYVE